MSVEPGNKVCLTELDSSFLVDDNTDLVGFLDFTDGTWAVSLSEEESTGSEGWEQLIEASSQDDSWDLDDIPF